MDDIWDGCVGKESYSEVGSCSQDGKPQRACDVSACKAHPVTAMSAGVSRMAALRNNIFNTWLVILIKLQFCYECRLKWLGAQHLLACICRLTPTWVGGTAKSVFSRMDRRACLEALGSSVITSVLELDHRPGLCLGLEGSLEL
eukprot:2498688-Amphidinium_carterae.1